MTDELREWHPDVRIVVSSNMLVPEMQEKAIELGADRYLMKSTVAPKEMVEVVRDVLAEPGGG